MRYPIAAAISPPRPLLPELPRPNNRNLDHWILHPLSEPEIELTFNDGSRATFVGPIVHDFIRRLPQPGERRAGQVWFPILYPTDQFPRRA